MPEDKINMRQELFKLFDSNPNANLKDAKEAGVEPSYGYFKAMKHQWKEEHPDMQEHSTPLGDVEVAQEQPQEPEVQQDIGKGFGNQPYITPAEPSKGRGAIGTLDAAGNVWIRIRLPLKMFALYEATLSDQYTEDFSTWVEDCIAEYYTSHGADIKFVTGLKNGANGTNGAMSGSWVTKRGKYEEED